MELGRSPPISGMRRARIGAKQLLVGFQSRLHFRDWRIDMHENFGRTFGCVQALA
jgi:hypothetical protein